MRRQLGAVLICVGLLSGGALSQPASSGESDKVEKIERAIKEYEKEKGKAEARPKESLGEEGDQGHRPAPNPDFDDTPEYPNPGPIVPEAPLNEGRDEPVIFPPLGPPPASVKDHPAPDLVPSAEDPVQAAISESLLPNPVQPSGQPLGLAECLDKAYLYHPQLQQYIQDIVQAEAQIRVVDASYLPILDITGDRTRDQDPDIEQDTTIQLNLTHTLWDGGQRSKQLKSAQASFRAAVRNFQSNWINRTQQVTAAYIAVLQAEYVEAIQADNLARTNLNYSVANAFYQGGLKSMIDVSTARVQQAQAQVSLVTAQNNVKTARISLAQAVGVPLEEVQRPLDLVPVLSATARPDREIALSYLETYHPALTSLTAQAESNFATAQANRRGNAPVFTANLYYGNIGINFPSAPIWQFQVELDFPIYKPETGAKGDASDAAGHALLKQREDQQLTLIKQLDSALADMEGARERAGYAVQGVRQALFNADLADRRYKVGLSDIQELINARGYVESARQDLVTALVDLKNAENLFYQAMGQVPLPPGFPADTPLLQQQIDELPLRDEVRSRALPPPEKPVNQR